MHTSLHQSSGTVLNKKTERMEESRDGKKNYEMMSPGPAMAVTLMDTAAVVTCARPSQEQARQNSSTDGGDDFQAQPLIGS